MEETAVGATAKSNQTELRNVADIGPDDHAATRIRPWMDAPVGMAVAKPDGRIICLNVVGQSIFEELAPSRSRMVLEIPHQGVGGSDARRLEWSEVRSSRDGSTIELQCSAELSGIEYSVIIQDVTHRRRRERRSAAVARTAARVVSERSLSTVLNALAQEIVQADGLAVVQVLTRGFESQNLQVLGMAGFSSDNGSEFFALLMECKRRGARLRMLEVMDSGRTAVIPDRYRQVMNDSAWKPLHDLLGAPRWEDFTSIPIIVRQRTIGILNLFLAPGLSMDTESLEFFSTMAEQAGLAIDYASLLESERRSAERAERQRLARDLHDSVVQGAFSMRMQVQALRLLAQADESKQVRQKIATIAGELDEISGSVLSDLRKLVDRTRPAPLGGENLGVALRNLVEATNRRMEIGIDLTMSDEANGLTGEVAEDIYHIAAEAIHNALKHASADRIQVSIANDPGQENLLLEVVDDGTANHVDGESKESSSPQGNGLVFMEQRAKRWDGSLMIDYEDPRGTTVSAVIPFRTVNTEENAS
ncbi:histidine kinase [Glutamicibacter creatinolyticus]|uniref:GAF domain-containing sensor histidine kinase n=1 Tax=Glutamicibacter creatinolyticus TaxID=162496 RepID=UPI0037BE9971